jgi:hypothetical protein
VRNDEYPIYVNVGRFRLLEASGAGVLRISTYFNEDIEDERLILNPPSFAARPSS